ncbi:DUF4432 family protein [Shinella sp.]|uniref:DUF4432 family protein n=1 Tax=Shinella sp. TaxID=1870904 RepID=UPI00258A35E1|nr:DUF4432 family protein [Shinella sp.]MCW5706895.1 DUF4432 family protein [Shinella sp.]
MKSVRVNLTEADFTPVERTFARYDEFEVRVFRYPLGVAALRLSNSAGHIIVLPFQGQQIWDAEFHGRRLTMKTVFDQPRPTTDFLNTYGAFLIHCGLTAVGPASRDDNHPPHGELPNAPFGGAEIEFGEDDEGPFASIRGRYIHKLAFHSDYELSSAITMRPGSGLLKIDLSVTNQKRTDMEFMYLAHANFRASAGADIRDNSQNISLRNALPTHVSPSDSYLAMIERLERDPQTHRRIQPDDVYDPEVVLYLNFVDENAWCLAEHEDGTTDVIRWSRAQMPHAVRWLSRTLDQECLGLALPGTAHPVGLKRIRENGQMIVLAGGQAFDWGFELGCLSANELREWQR